MMVRKLCVNMVFDSGDKEISCVLCEEVFETKHELHRHTRLKYNGHTYHGFPL